MSKTKTATTNQTVPAAAFGWFYGKNGSIKTVVSKPFTTDELKKQRN